MLLLAGRYEGVVERVRDYMQAQGMFYSADSADTVFSEPLSLDMGTVEPSLAGPTRPQDRVALKDLKSTFANALTETFAVEDDKRVEIDLADKGKTELFNESL